MAAITLTEPLNKGELTQAYPRETRGMEDGELKVKLRVLERTLRVQYHVSEASAACDDAMRDAMIAAWPSYLAQVSRIASESSTAEGYSVTYDRTQGDKMTFPALVESILADFVDAPDANEPGSVPGISGSTTTPNTFVW